MTPRNVRRRERRHFQKMVTTHPILLSFYEIPEVAERYGELERVLAEFYVAGMDDAMGMAITAAHKAIDDACSSVRKL